MRYEKTVDGQTINHVWDGSKQIIADVIDNQFYEADCYIRGTNLVAKYNYRNGDKSEYTYYTQNAHGDAVNITDKDGKVTKKYTYDAFGVEKNIDENDTNAFRYCGEYFDDETGTIYLRARYYNPSTGRFISRDSFAGRKSDPLSLNLYTYYHNNPIRYIDPSGHFIGALIAGALAVGVSALLTGCDNDDVNSKVKYDVPLYEQKDTNLCWAYSQVMIEAYNNKKDYTEDEADDRAKELAIERNDEDNWNRGGLPLNLGPKTSAFELKGIESLKKILDENGPVYASYWNYIEGEGSSGHMVVVTGVDVSNDEVYTNNPNKGGIKGEQSYEEFLNDYDTGFLGGDSGMTLHYISIPE